MLKGEKRLEGKNDKCFSVFFRNAGKEQVKKEEKTRETSKTIIQQPITLQDEEGLPSKKGQRPQCRKNRKKIREIDFTGFFSTNESKILQLVISRNIFPLRVNFTSFHTVKPPPEPI